MELYLLRHGKAQEHIRNVSSDAKRELTETGKSELECIGKAMRNLDISVDGIISSPLVRAKQTSEIIQKHLGLRNPVVIWDELKPETDADETIRKLTGLKRCPSILIVGHEPHMTNLVQAIISDKSGHVDVSLKKGGLVHIRCNVTLSKFSGTLRLLMAPKQLKKLCK